MSIFKWGVLLVALLVGAVALGAGVATAHDSGTEVRITAMRLDDGRIEFALQEREGEGWGERILPRGRFFPTTSSGRWLNSTPITVGVVWRVETPGDDAYADDLRPLRRLLRRHARNTDGVTAMGKAWGVTLSLAPHPSAALRARCGA